MKHGFEIARPSLCCVFLEMFFDETKLSTGSGCVIEEGGRFFVATARHNLTGLHQQTGKCLHSKGGIPNRVVATLAVAPEGASIHLVSGLPLPPGKEVMPFKWHGLDIRIVSIDGDPCWVEHPTLGAAADLAVIEIFPPDGCHFYGFSTQAHISVQVSETEDEDVIPRFQMMSSFAVAGYPFGRAGALSLPIWSNATLASDYDLEIDGKPIFYVDCRSRRGQSGAPVFFWSDEVYAKDSEWHSFKTMSKNHILLGIYSGRIHEDSDIGVVWRTSSVRETIGSIGAQEK